MFPSLMMLGVAAALTVIDAAGDGSAVDVVARRRGVALTLREHRALVDVLDGQIAAPPGTDR
jgi:hypothetical protein